MVIEFVTRIIVESMSGALIGNPTSYLSSLEYMLPGERRISHTCSDASSLTVDQSGKQFSERNVRGIIVSLKDVSIKKLNTCSSISTSLIQDNTKDHPQSLIHQPRISFCNT
jgi:hypothetical protein